MAFGFKKSSGASHSGSKASANPQPVAAPMSPLVSQASVSRAPTIDVHPAESLKKSSVFPSAALAVAISPEQIRARAFEIYLARGDKPGDAVSDWNQAERELRSTAMGVASRNA